MFPASPPPPSETLLIWARVVAAPEHQAIVAFRVLQKHLVPSQAPRCCCGSMTDLLLIRCFGFSAFLIPDICLFFI